MRQIRSLILPLLLIGSLLAAPQPLVAQSGPGPLSVEWQSPASDDFTAIALFDIDGDGDDDLAVGRRDLPTQILRNDSTSGQQIFTPVWDSGVSRNTVGLAWATTDSGDLLLAEANYDDEPTIVYRVSAPGGAIGGSVIFTGALGFAQSLAWGFIDGDAEPDLVVGGELEPIRIYFGSQILAGPTGAPFSFGGGTTTVSSLALADMDGDGRQDLVVGNRGAPSAIYAGTGPSSFFNATPIWSDSATNTNTRAVLAEDFDGDGRADLFIASVIESSRLYLGQAGAPLTLSLAWVLDQRINAIAAAAADYDADGRVDIALTSEPRSDVIQTLPIGEHLLHNTGSGGFTLSATIANRATNVSRLAWGALVGGRTPDLASVRLGAPARIYRNNLSGAIAASVSGAGGGPAAGAIFFRQPAGSTAAPSPVVSGDRPLRADTAGSVSLTGLANNGDAIAVLQPVGDIAAFSSGGPPIPISSSAPTVITATIEITRAGFIQYIEAVELSGTHTYFSDLEVTLISPAGSQVRLLGGACGDADGFSVSVSDSAAGAATCPPVSGAAFRAQTPLDDLRGESIAGVWQLVVADTFAFDGGQLTGWGLRALVNDAPLYYTSFAPADTPAFSAISDQTPNSLAVSADNPLLLFDLDVSLEWDARNEAGYLAQLRADLLRASELLYDWTNGQLALGRVRIYHDRARWATADVRVYASNRVRPNADRGGIVGAPTTVINGNGEEQTFYPGQVRIGATWSQYGASRSSVGEDWPRALAHELGHYLLFLADNYIGYDEVAGRKVLVGIDGCPGAMANPYREEQSEFHPLDARWGSGCANTISQLENGRSDWETIVAFYPALAAHRPASLGETPGPNALALGLTEVIEVPAAAPARAVRQSSFSLLQQTAAGPIRLQPDRSARGILFADDSGDGVADRLVDLGGPVRDQIEARGARPGDRLCLFEPAARRLGCVDPVVSGETTLTVDTLAGWQPDIRIEPLGGQQIRVTVQADGVGAGVGGLRARLFPINGEPTAELALGLSGASFSGTITTSARFQQALLQVWVDEPAPRRESVTDLSLYFYPADQPPPPLLRAGPPIASPAKKPCNPKVQTCPDDAPASLDGQAMVYDLDGVFGPGDLFSFQAATRPPVAAPPWSEQVGPGYWLRAGAATDLAGLSLNLSYSEDGLPPGTAGGLSIYAYTPAANEWRELTVRRRDLERRELTGDSQGAALYALLTSLRPSLGWNLLAYPWAGESVPAALARLNVDARHYRAVYGYDEVTGRWQLYDPTVPADFAPLVNTLARPVYGRGYWVHVTDAGPAVAAPASGPAAATSASLPLPPATYYGYIYPVAGASFSAGQRVEALVDGVVCGVGTAQSVGGRLGYAIDVVADQVGSAGCGAPGRGVSFRVGGVPVRAGAIWSSVGATRLDFNPGIWLPFAQRGTSVCIVQCP